MRPFRAVLAEADREAERIGDLYVGDEHLFLALMHDDEVAPILEESARLDLQRARAAICTVRARRGQPPPDDAALLSHLGVDLAAIRATAEQAFGADAVAEASLRANRRGRRRRGPASSFCGRALLAKPALERAMTSIADDHCQRPALVLLASVLEEAQLPLGGRLSRRGRAGAPALGVRVGEPNPLALLLALCDVDLTELQAEVRRAVGAT